MQKSYSDVKSTSGWAAYRSILGYLCVFIALIGVLMLLPLIFIAFYPSEYAAWKAFAIPGLSCLVFGVVTAIALMYKAPKIRLGKHQDSVLLVAIWLFSITLGCLPFFLAQYLDGDASCQASMSISFSEAFFESMSGFAAVGLTIFQNFPDSAVSYCPHIFGIYRILTHFVGGVGLVLVVASAVSDRYGLKLFYTEGHNDRLLPNLAKTAKVTFALYSAIIALGTLGLLLCGYPWFDALGHSIAAMATGGFSTIQGGVAAYATYEQGIILEGAILPLNALGGEIVMIFIMLGGATSFLLLFNLFTFKWKKFFRDSELLFSCIFLIIFISLGTLSILYQFNNGSGEIDFWTSLRYSAFQIVSCMSTTGFTNVSDLLVLGSTAIWLSVLTMLVGGGMGSTAGAIKQWRVMVVLKELWWSIKYRLSPSKMRVHRPLVRAGVVKEASQEEFSSAALYLVLYLLVVFALTVVLSFLPGLEFEDSIFEVASALSGTGNTIFDIYGYGHSSGEPLWAYNVLLWVLSFAMFLGRLEILPVYFGAVRLTKDIFRQETVQ